MLTTQTNILLIVYVHSEHLRIVSRTGRHNRDFLKSRRGTQYYQTWRQTSNICFFKATDLVKQSIPFAYMAVSAVSTNGAAHTVQVYSDISAEWVSGNNALLAKWSTTTGPVLTHEVQLQSPAVFTEVNDHTQCNVSLPSLMNSSDIFHRWISFLLNDKCE